jgi:TolB protein
MFACLIQYGQFLEIAAGQNITVSQGDNLFPSWSPDGSRLVYQSNRSGNWDIMVYELATDSSFTLLGSPNDEQHPVWFSRGEAVAYDSDLTGQVQLYSINITDRGPSLLFERDIQARYPFLSLSEKLVYFSGFDEQRKRWEIFSFEFYYNNLNQLTSLGGESSRPMVSPDSDRVLFTNHKNDFPQDKMHLMNWYGNPEREFDEFNISDPSWSPDGLKIFFVSDMDSQSGEVYSMWLDGSHLERLTSDTLEVRNPVVSPDGRKLVVSVKYKDGFDLCIIPMEDY